MQNSTSPPAPQAAPSSHGFAKIFFTEVLAPTLAVIALLVAIPVVISIASGLLYSPLVGTYHMLKEDRLGYAVVVYPQEGSPGFTKSWEPVCTLRKGGRMTLTERLFIRRDVSPFYVLTGFYDTGVYVYTPPKGGPQGCPRGFSEAMTHATYPASQ